MATPDPNRIERRIKLQWGDAGDLPLLFANHLLSQAQPQDGVLYLMLGARVAAAVHR